MLNEEQLAILRKGADVWNKWKKENPFAILELSDAYLAGADLRGVDLTGANLRRANLRGANLSKASLGNIDLRQASLSGADLSGATILRTILRSSDLTGCNLEKTKVASTIFADLDLSEAIGLEGVFHYGPSSISADTFLLSNGKIPKAFLLGCGLSDWEIEEVKLYKTDLSNEEVNSILYRMYELRGSQALQISPLFISYNHADSTFVDKLETQLNDKGIRFWRDVHDMKSGRMETQVDRAIRQNPTVLLILSQHSLQSDWVEHEVRMARGLEKEMGRDVLCPVALDDSWKDSPWPKRVMEQVMEYNILDFSAWRDDSKFGSTFNKLIDGLELFYKR